MIKSLDHLNLVVHELDKMVRFYTDVLGLTVAKRVTISGKWIDNVVGLKDAQAEVVYLEFPSGPRIELIRYESPKAAESSGIHPANAYGFRHIAFRVDEIDVVVARLREVRAEVFSEVQMVPESQVQYAGGVRKRLVYFRDPEGNILELCEYKAPD